MKRALGRTGIHIAPLVFGGNVFGWTVDERGCAALLDRFIDAGLNAIDTANVYAKWVPGNRGGESETLIGRWLKAAPERRAKAVIITKVGIDMPGLGAGLSRQKILASAEDSLRRLQTDYIDLYLSHRPDASTPIEETLRAYEQLIQQGKIRAIGASNSQSAGLREALDVSAQKNLPRYEVEQPEYNLYDRDRYEGPLRDLCIAEGLGVIPYYSLASGFLSGKYRSKADLGKSVRGERVGNYLNERGMRILQALDTVAAEQRAQPAEIALAWLIGREGVTAPIASATSIAQVECLVRATQITLSPSQTRLLDAAGASAD